MLACEVWYERLQDWSYVDVNVAAPYAVDGCILHHILVLLPSKQNCAGSIIVAILAYAVCIGLRLDKTRDGSCNDEAQTLQACPRQQHQGCHLYMKPDLAGLIL